MAISASVLMNEFGQLVIIPMNQSPFLLTPTPVAHINDSATNAPVDAATNAPTDARTDYGPIAAILGADANSTNAKQNSTATIVNANAVKQNAGFAILNTLATRFNLNLDILEANGFMAA